MSSSCLISQHNGHNPRPTRTQPAGIKCRIGINVSFASVPYLESGYGIDDMNGNVLGTVSPFDNDNRDVLQNSILSGKEGQGYGFPCPYPSRLYCPLPTKYPNLGYRFSVQL